MNKIQEIEYKKIKEKLANREYRIGLDLGVGSIGYAIVSLKKCDDSYLPEDIILTGSRIFNSSIGAVDRRMFRLQRNTHRHRRERMRFLWKLLAEKKLALPPSEDLERKEKSIDCETSQKRFPIEVLKNDPYTLRYKVLDEKLSLFQLGYALYHIANHRGTDSVRSFLEDADEKVKENTETAKLAKKTKEIINDKKYRTFGEYLYKEKIENSPLNEREKVTNRKTAKNPQKEFAVTRDIVSKEVEKILAHQKQYHTNILTDDYIEELKKAIFYQTEKLIPESGYCPYFKDEKRLPRSHKLNEHRRMYEALNNVRYFNPVINEKTGEVLNFEEKEFLIKEKEILFNELLKGTELTEVKVKKLLQLPEHSEIHLQGRDKKKIKGYALAGLEALSFWPKLSPHQDEFLHKWNSLPDEQLKAKLIGYGLTENEVDELFDKIRLPSSYAPIGKKAMEILLTYIKKDGLSYTEALDKAIDEGKFKVDKQSIYDSLPYYGKIIQESTQRPIGKSFSKQFADKNYKKPNINKDEEEFGKIANPVVHQTLNELRKLVNEIITLFGKKLLEIGLETARELKKSKKDRESLSKQQDENEKHRNEIYKTYIEPHLSYIKSRQENPSNYILKFELSEEQKYICPFCIEEITPDDIINSRVDIEHLFPLSESEDDTKNNLVIAHNKCNADKAKKSPFNAFGHEVSGKYVWNKILRNAQENLPRKAWRFYQDSIEKFLENKPMLNRFKPDNSYISKIAARYLACLFDNFDKSSKVFCVKSSLIAQLRIAWELNSVMIPLAKNILSEKEFEEFKTPRNKKIRMDNRHHALDAVAIAYANRGYHNFLNRIHAKGYKPNYREKSWLSKILLPPLNRNLEDFKISVKNSIENANISIKHDHSTNGSLVKDTAYKVYYFDEEKYIITTLKNVAEIPFKEKESPKDTLHRALCEFKNRLSDIKDEELIKKLKHNICLYEKILDTLSEAKQQLEQTNNKEKEEGKKPKDITDVLIYKKACNLIGGKYIDCNKKLKDKFFPVKEPAETKTGFGYDTGDNLFLDLYHDKTGKLCGEIIRKINFNRNKVPNYQNKGYRLFERIYQGDTLEVDISEDKISLKNKVGSFRGNRTFVKVLTFTESNQYFNGKKDQIQIFFGNLLKANYKQDDSFYISSMQQYNLRKVILTSLGIIKYRSQILKNKEV